MQAAASDLDIDLDIYESDVSDRFARVTAAVDRLTTEPLPDAAVFSVEFGQALPLMNAAEQSKIPFFLNGPLFPEELLELGEKPGQKYRYWHGYFLEDEEMKGYLLAKKLIAAARDSNNNGQDSRTVHVAGINGNRSWYGSILREAGLRRAIEEDPDALLLQMVYTRWTPEEGRSMAYQLLRRYPEISVIWAASDQLALGAAEALANPRSDNVQVYIGGLDLSGAGIDSVLRGELRATVASTNLIWAQVIVDLHDHLQGLNITGHIDSVFTHQSIVAEPSTAENIRKNIRNFDMIDFRHFSRFHYGTAARRLSDLMEEL